MLIRSIVLPCAVLVSMGASQVAFAQSDAGNDKTTASPCRVDPGTDDGTSLSETLDDCNGVLKPPRVGDPDMVQSAPDVGETPVIRPNELPEQQSQDENPSGDPDSSSSSSAYTTGQIVDAIGMSSDLAAKLKSTDPITVEVLDISILFDGVDAAVINASLAAHEQGSNELRDELSKHNKAVEALEAKGLSSAGVVAAKIDPAGALTVYAR